jgi:hypothetical protein
MEFRSECGRCHRGLSDPDPAYFCAHECTYCATCVRELAFVCPNCSGELVRRPRKYSPPAVPSKSPSTASTPATIRPGRVEDLDALAAMFDAYRQFYHQPPNLAAARAFLQARLRDASSDLLIAELAGATVGFAQLYPSFTSITLGPILVLNDLFVAPGVRHSGVGAGLLAAARAHGLARGAHYLELSTAIDNPAQRLYEASGWRLDREYLHYELPLDHDRSRAPAPEPPTLSGRQ